MYLGLALPHDEAGQNLSVTIHAKTRHRRDTLRLSPYASIHRANLGHGLLRVQTTGLAQGVVDWKLLHR